MRSDAELTRRHRAGPGRRRPVAFSAGGWVCVGAVATQADAAAASTGGLKVFVTLTGEARCQFDEDLARTSAAAHRPRTSRRTSEPRHSSAARFEPARHLGAIATEARLRRRLGRARRRPQGRRRPLQGFGPGGPNAYGKPPPSEPHLRASRHRPRRLTCLPETSCDSATDDPGRRPVGARKDEPGESRSA